MESFLEEEKGYWVERSQKAQEVLDTELEQAKFNVRRWQEAVQMYFVLDATSNEYFLANRNLRRWQEMYEYLVSIENFPLYVTILTSSNEETQYLAYSKRQAIEEHTLEAVAKREEVRNKILSLQTLVDDMNKNEILTRKERKQLIFLEERLEKLLEERKRIYGLINRYQQLNAFIMGPRFYREKLFNEMKINEKKNYEIAASALMPEGMNDYQYYVVKKIYKTALKESLDKKIEVEKLMETSKKELNLTLNK